MPMRWKRDLALLGSALLIAAGVWTVVRAPEVVRWRPLVPIGQQLHWPGTYATDTTGCRYEPDYRDWERPIVIAGCLLGVGGCFSGMLIMRQWVIGWRPTDRQGPPGSEIAPK